MAKLINNTGIPDGYYQKLVERGRALYGRGPTARDQSEMAQMMFAMFSAVQGNEEELTEIGRNIIMQEYGDILDGVTLDLKIINPGDEEQIKMAKKTTKPPEVKIEKEDITHLTPDIDKRKLLNVLMQGESQNIHDLLYMVKDQMDAIDPALFRLDLGVIKKDILLHWNDQLDLQGAMEGSYQYANIVEVKWPPDTDPTEWSPDDDDEEGEEGEEGNGEGPTIKVRALMLSGLLHETVKGIYELIAAQGIEEDVEKMKRVMSQTDNLTNEKEDIQFGSFVAADLRDFVNKAIENVPQAAKIKNMREFIFGWLAQLPAEEFIEKMKGILANDPLALKDMESNIKLLSKEISQQTSDYEKSEIKYGIEPEEYEEPEAPPAPRIPIAKPEPKEEPKKQKKFSEYSQGELNNMINKAIDDNDWDLAREIQKHIRESKKIKTSLKLKL